MADSIVRLKVDSQEYDNKLKRAAEGIQRYADGCRKAGGTLTQLDDGVEQFVKELGKMETVSNSARGKISEMTKAFTDLSVQYNKLTEEEKNSPFGKALAESLNTLKGRIKDGNTELKNISTSLNDTGGVMGMLKDKLTVNIDAMKLFSVGLQAAKAALDVAKDAFFNNEEQLDDWGRTVESSESLYNGFLNALNTGDISGYLQNIDNITKAARAAYDALDALNTFNAFNQINVEKTRTGMTESIASYREGTGTREDVKAAGEAYKKELQERKKLEKEAYIEAVGKVAAERGVSKNDLLTALSGTYGSYQQLKNMPMSGTETRFYGTGMFGGGGSYQVAVPNSVQEKLGDALRKLNDTELQSLQALGAQAERTGNEIASVDKQLTRILNGRQGGASGSTGGGGGSRAVNKTETFAADSIAAQEKRVSDLTKKWKEAGAAVRDDYAVQLGYAKQRLAEMTGGFDPGKMKDISGQSVNLTQDTEKLNDLQAQRKKAIASGDTELSKNLLEQINQVKSDPNGLTLPVKLEIQSPVQQWQSEIKRLQEEMNTGLWSTDAIQAYSERIDQLQKQVSEFSGNLDKGGENSSKSWSNAATAIGSVGNAINSIEDPTAKIVGLVAQGIAAVISATGIATEKAAGQSRHWAEYLAAAASITAQMIMMISQIHSASGYANGGIVKGNSYSGDNIPADTFVNAGELILNKSQQGAIASQLQNGGGNLRVTGVLRGEDLLISIDKSARRQGRGELVFWKDK